MKHTETDFSTEDSLRTITEMIEQAKGNMSSASFHFLLWGWIVVIASLTHYVLEVYTDFAAPYAVWLIGIPGWIISFMYGYRNARKQRVRTYSDGLVMWTWVAFSICIITIILAGKYVNYNITALIILFSALATFVTGMIINFKPLKIGGAALWLFAPVAFYVGPVDAQLVFVVAIVAGYLIPAYMLKRQS